MLKIEHLTKCYGDHKAVDDLTLNIESGEIYAFIGHNGAGKTTTLKAVAGILPFESGPWIEGNTFCGQMDDAINIKTALIAVDTRLAAGKFRVKGSFEARDSLRLYNPRTGEMKGWYEVKSVERITGGMAEMELTEDVAGSVMTGRDKCSDMFFNDNCGNIVIDGNN